MTFKELLTTPIELESDGLARLTDIYISPNSFDLKFIEITTNSPDTTIFGQTSPNTQIKNDKGLLKIKTCELMERLPNLTLKVDTAFSETYKKLFFLPKEAYEFFENLGLRIPISPEEANISEEITKEYAQHMDPVISLAELLTFQLKEDNQLRKILDFDVDLSQLSVKKLHYETETETKTIQSDLCSLSLIDLAERVIELNARKSFERITARSSV